MAHRTLSVLLALVVCFAVGANAQCNLMVQDQPQYYTTCPGDNYTATILFYNSGTGPCNVGGEVTLSAGVTSLTFGTSGNPKAKPDSPSDIAGITLNPIPAGSSVIFQYQGIVAASAAGTNITSTANGTAVGGTAQFATATTQVLTFAQCGLGNPPPAPPGPPPPMPPPPSPSPPSPSPPMPPPPPVVITVTPRPHAKPHAKPHTRPHAKPHPKPTPAPVETTVTLGAAQRGAITASSVLGCLHLSKLVAGEEIVIVVKPELRANGSVKTNPDSLIRSSLKLSGVSARVSPHGDVVANYRPSTHTLAVAFPASVRKFKAQHAVVLTGRYRLSGSKTAAFMSKPIRVC